MGIPKKQAPKSACFELCKSSNRADAEEGRVNEQIWLNNQRKRDTLSDMVSIC